MVGDWNCLFDVGVFYVFGLVVFLCIDFEVLGELW